MIVKTVRCPNGKTIHIGIPSPADADYSRYPVGSVIPMEPPKLLRGGNLRDLVNVDLICARMNAQPPAPVVEPERHVKAVDGLGGHIWRKDEKGEPDHDGWAKYSDMSEVDFGCDGFICERCGYRWCVACHPEGPAESCEEENTDV